MKKIWIFILSLFAVTLVWNYTQANDEYEYTNLNITANILEDWTIDVKEDFSVDFFVDKHWIIRTIPLNYSVEWKDFHIKVSNIDVEWKKFKTSRTNKEREIKIWDSKKVVNWRQNYSISYSTYGLIRNFSWMGYAELYWNLVWYDFDTNINQVIAEFVLPKTYTWFTADDFLITTNWETNTIDWFDWTVDWSKWDIIIITYNEQLPAYQWITLAIKFPNDYFEFDHKAQEKSIWKYNEFFLTPYIKYIWWYIWWYIRTWEIIFICIFLAGFIINIPTKIKERKNVKKYPIIIQYSAPKWMNPSEVWLLYNRCTKPSQIVSLIYERAAQWHISFNTSDKTWIVKNDDLYSNEKKRNSTRNDYKRTTWNTMFNNATKMSVPNTRFNQKLQSIENQLYKHGLKQSWFKYNDESKSNDIEKGVRWKVLLWFFALGFFSFIVERLYLFLRSIAWIFLSCLLTKFDGKPALSDKWYKLLSEIKWYRNFIRACDKNKFKKFLEEDPMFFDKTLPYAVALGLETSFMKKFEPILKENWITSNFFDIGSSDISPRKTMNKMNSGIHNQSYHHKPSWSHSSYSSSGWFSSWSSFWWWRSGWWGGFSSGWWWGWWGWRSW